MCQRLIPPPPPSLLLVVVLVAIPSVTQGAGFAFSKDFLVVAPDQALADEVLARAEAFRKQVADAWFGEELPPGEGAAVIRVTLSDTDDSGFAWTTDGPTQRLPHLALTGTREAVTGPTLHHEVVHAVLAARFPDGLPAWIDEGIASGVDGQERLDARQRILQRFARSGAWPDFASVLQMPAIPSHSQSSYTVAASLTEYLLSRGDKAKLLRFGVTGKQHGWDRALRQHYGVASVADLEAAWQTWASQPARLYARTASTHSNRLSAAIRRRR
jgi:hypothetical protein